MTTDKEGCNIIVDLLVAHGVTRAVVSPGSRNAPLIVAVSRCGLLRKTVVIDERCAAFVAVGMAAVLQEPVALICTSGSAVLNYAPAVAEAYYRELPLIIISADRPPEWIDQNDSQTIRQSGVLSNIVKSSCYIAAEIGNGLERRVAERTVNDVLLAATTGRKAPVHINLSIAEPLDGMKERKLPESRSIELVRPSASLPLVDIRRLAMDVAAPRKIMILGGNHCPSQQLNRALTRLSRHDNIVVLCENITNLHGDRFIDTVDMVLTAVDERVLDELAPDVVISFGGAPVSAILKRYLRRVGPEHWSVGVGEWSLDTYLSLSKRIDTDAASFFAQLASTLRNSGQKCDYAARWMAVRDNARCQHDRYVAVAPWSDLKAFSLIYAMIPQSWNVQLSNGMSVRYSQIFSSRTIHRSDSNRGVSGIDGCTSTAIGASTVYNGTTLLISGDMSAAYDVGALALPCITPRFKMIVMCNGGGDIFRQVSSTSRLPEREEYFACDVRLPMRQLAAAYGFDFHEANDESSLVKEFKAMGADGSRPSILAVYTPAGVNSVVMNEYINRIKNKLI